ncbi:hypothetical protein COEREDRAFT_83550 [Coemansia reversa NRRL 1564]|uniref:Uncharacterized protein n=1 Tax=Coemansia reversa (strain ATCC 12441 / NRRL 1564) TaxID=763665 RepID=A0A2G5B2Z6_COERN|nr:hypothetical protein COEREDRAFT_83550 [Coemansia reversa NRRL 1564]|eukprot:PIA13374.1 hypothetical protein COEREDRAFT_83550 [Coemansia reversa NRRL 1564]
MEALWPMRLQLHCLVGNQATCVDPLHIRVLRLLLPALLLLSLYCCVMTPEPSTLDPVEFHATSIYGDESASGIVPESTFLYTGEYPFPGISTDQLRGSRCTTVSEDHGEEQTTDSLQNTEEASIESSEYQKQETVSQLGVAMEDQLPAAYKHGVGVDCSRGIVLAPRAIPGMLYDTRLIRTMFHTRFSARNAAERPLFVGADKNSADQSVGSRTLAYKFGDMLILVFGTATKTETLSSSTVVGQPNADIKDEERRIQRGRRGRRARVRAKASKKNSLHSENTSQSNNPFSAHEAQNIEQTILRYAESLHAATWRDSRDVETQRKSEMQLAEQRRIPPYVYQSKGVLPITHTSYRHYTMPTNLSYAGYLYSEMTVQGGKDIKRMNSSKNGLSPLPNNVRHALDVVSSEIERTLYSNDVAVCVRMQDKGWVSGSSLENHTYLPTQCYCVIDQPNATLADAQNLLSRISHRAVSQNMSPINFS